MTHYAVNISPPPVNSHRFLIGPPLVVVSLFCFAFVLVQPHNQTQAKTAAASQPSISSTDSTKAALSQSTQANLPKLSKAQPVITASPATNPMTTSASNPSSTLSTAASQSSNTGATASLQPAAAKPNNQAIGQQLIKNLNSITNGLNLTK